MDELSVRIRYSGEPGALMGRIFGVSTSGTYGYYSQLEDRTSARRADIYWTAREGARTLATIANFGDADDITLELFNADGLSYATQVELAANEAKTIDLAELGANAFGVGSSGGWNVSRNGGGSLVVKNHVVEKSGFSLPFYGASPYVTEIYLTGSNAFEMDSADPDHTFQCRKRWSDNFTEPSPGGESSTENSNVATVDIASDPSGNWDVQAVGPGTYNYIRIEQWIPWDETFNFEPQFMMAQADANVKCNIVFASLTKKSGMEGVYDAVVSVNSEACADSQKVSMGLAPLCGGHTWSYPGNGTQSINAGQSKTFTITITYQSGATPVSCSHRFTPTTCGANCPSNPAFRDGDPSGY